jgi:hypothetical protein
VVPRLRTGVVDGPVAGPLLAGEAIVGVAGCVAVPFGLVVGSLAVVPVVVAVVAGFVPADEVLRVTVVLVAATGRGGVVAAFAGVVDGVDARVTEIFRRPLALRLGFDAFVTRRADRR